MQVIVITDLSSYLKTRGILCVVMESGVSILKCLCGLALRAELGSVWWVENCQTDSHTDIQTFNKTFM